MNTKNILFILGGAFEGLENIVKARVGKTTIGFTGGRSGAGGAPGGHP